MSRTGQEMLISIIRPTLFAPYIVCYGLVAAFAGFVVCIFCLEVLKGPVKVNEEALEIVVLYSGAILGFVLGAICAWRSVANRILHTSVLLIGLVHVIQGIVVGNRYFAAAAEYSNSNWLGDLIAGVLLYAWAVVGAIAGLAGACGLFLSVLRRRGTKVEPGAN